MTNQPAETNVVAIGQSETTALMNMISKAATDPSADIDKMERLYAMYEKAKAKEAETAFNAAMKAAQEEIEPIARNRQNNQTNSTYADLDAVLRAVKPVVTKHGFSTSFGNGTSDKEDHYRVTCVLSHEAGYSRDYFADIPVDKAGIKGVANKADIHAFGSSMSYGRRYLQLLIWDISTYDDDGVRNAGSTITQSQSDDLRKLIDETDTRVDIFCGLYGIERLGDMKQANFAPAMKQLRHKQKLAKQAEGTLQ